MNSSRWTEQDLADFQIRKAKEAKRGAVKKHFGAFRSNKYGAKKTVVDGRTFDSKKEAARYGELKTLEGAGGIKHLELQVRVPLEVNGIKICTYVCDFRYSERNGGGWTQVYEDAKGVRTPTYRLKKKLVRAIIGVEIKET